MRIALALIVVVAGCAHNQPADRPSKQSSTTRPAETAEQHGQRIDAAIERGVQWLLQNQSADGAWGTGLVTRGFEVYSVVPGTLYSMKAATTGLCVMALRELNDPRTKAAHDRGVEFLLTNSFVGRDTGDLIYNLWAHFYTIEALAGELPHNPDPRIRQVIAHHVDRLVRYECYGGGWNYYDFEVGTQKPASGGTSFGTAAGLVSLWAARQAGCDVPQPLIDRAVRTLEQCRLPNGAYLYGFEHRYIPRLPANQLRGSIGRSQACNVALTLWRSRVVGRKQVLDGLDAFDREHVFIEMGAQRQFPHEAWYQTAPYYYYFGHYYAARLVETLKGDARARFAQVVSDAVLSRQQTDGSWWDYAMWDFHKPYGTAYAIMTLLRCR